MIKFVFSTVLLVLILNGVASKGLPSYVKLCKKTDPNIEKCILDNVKIVEPYIKDGIPELNIPSLNPLKVPEATLKNGNSFFVQFKDIEVYNAEHFKIEHLVFDLDKPRAEIKAVLPLLRIKGIYNLHGKLSVLNLDGQGLVDGNYTNVHGSITLKGSHFEKHNKKFIRWEKETSDFKIEKIHLYFDKVFGDKKELNDQTNKVINENIDAIIEDLSPIIKQVVSDFFISILGGLFMRYPEEELFPPS